MREGKALHHRADLHHRAGWVSFRLQTSDDVEKAKDLIQIAYAYARRTVEGNAV